MTTKTVLDKKSEKELVPLKKGISGVAMSVNELKIVNQNDMKTAVDMLSQLNKYGDSVKAKKELLTKPLNLALRNARSMFAPIEDLYEGAVEVLRNKMTEYQTEKVRIENEEKTKIAARVGEGKGKFKVETAVAKIAEVEVAEKEVATEEGLVQFREVKVVKIMDETLIPREYLVIDEKKVLEALKAGKFVEGAVLESKQVPVNYR